MLRATVSESATLQTLPLQQHKIALQQVPTIITLALSIILQALPFYINRGLSIIRS